jgi:predicted phage terminase large subunit-like protein
LSALTTIEVAERLLAVNDKLLQRRAALGSLVDWMRLAYAPLIPQPHHILIAEYLEALERGEITRLLIFAPPGSGKSFVVSRAFVSWVMARNPKWRVIGGANVQNLANDFSEQVRNDIEQWTQTLGIALNPAHKAKENWQLMSGGRYWAVGIGTSVLGRRCELCLVDDPIKSADAAYSEVEREITRRWFQNDLRSRWTPDCRVCLIGTRWHSLDLFGYLLEEMKKGGEQWVVLSLPAESLGEHIDPLKRPKGAFLWDDDATWSYGKKVRAEKATLSTRDYSALYLQNPLQEGGNYFESNWIKFYGPQDLPPRQELAIYAGVDIAVSHGENDYSTCAIVGVDLTGRWYVLDLWRKQAAADEVIDSIIDICKRWYPLNISVESGVITRALGPMWQRRMQERRSFTRVEQFPRKHDKTVMARSLQAKMAFSGLWLPQNALWVPDLVEELVKFPAAPNDDQVDALVAVSMQIHKMVQGYLPPPPLAPTCPPGAIVLPDIMDEQYPRHKRPGPFRRIK